MNMKLSQIFRSLTLEEKIIRRLEEAQEGQLAAAAEFERAEATLDMYTRRVRRLRDALLQVREGDAHVAR